MARFLLRCRLVLAVEIEERFFFFLFWRRARRERDISGFFLVEGVRICAVASFVGNCRWERLETGPRAAKWRSKTKPGIGDRESGLRHDRVLHRLGSR